MTMPAGVTTDSVDYLQRCVPLVPDLSRPQTAGVPQVRRLLRVRSVGRPDKGTNRPRLVADNKPTRLPRVSGESWRPRTTELITGLYGSRIPVAFYVLGAPDGIRVQLGTWSAKTASAAVQDRRRDVLRAVLGGLYTSVKVEQAAEASWRWPVSGVALGVPDPAGIEEADGSAPIDRILASMAGTSWAALVLAYPVAESAVARVRQQVLNELRAVATGAQAEGAPSPLAEQYVELLKVSLASLGEGMATGAWRTGVYLLGMEESYPRLAAAWRSVFSGVRSLPEPVRVFDLAAAASLADAWALPDQPGAAGPGHYQRPFELQTLLTTSQLAAYVHLPELETPGFAVDTVARFDTVPAPARGGEGLAVGRIVYQRQETASDYRVALSSLARHVFVAGVTGSGKTNTVLSLLIAADAAQVPFLVVEPAKIEYRALMADPRLGNRLRVFTAGKAGVSPLLLNPFEVPAGTTVSEHLDLVRAAFSVAFGMWTPLPQILERCLHAIYVDRGWDLRTNSNIRLQPGDDPTLAYPTLADLVAKAEEVIPTLGYEERITGDLRAALVTRLESLRSGGKGAMLDVARSQPSEELFGQPTIVELEAMGDDDDKAFVAALLLIRLAEHRRAQGQRPSLVHLLVIEEAHRLLSEAPSPRSEEVADPRGQAVETFSNLLSEVRAYGQGIIIADQVPVRLAPGVIKNTDLKICHRIVAADDRTAMAGAMVMDESQARALATLEVGQAAVFSSGDDAPMLVQVPLTKDQLAPTPPGDQAVIRHMAGWRATNRVQTLFLPRPFCAQTCAGTPLACTTARQLMADRYLQQTVARVVLATIEQAGALDRLWNDLEAAISARRPPRVGQPELLRALAGHAADWYANRRGAQGVWSYADTTNLGDLLRAVLVDKLDNDNPAVTAQLRDAFQHTARRLHRRAVAPYPVCEHVCTQNPPLCLYRSAVADVVASGRFQQSWRAADAADATSADSRRQQTWEVCQDAAYELVEFPEQDTPQLAQQIVATAKRVCLCFEQQMLADDLRKVPRTTRRILARVLAEADL
jgi:hypothetical protein